MPVVRRRREEEPMFKPVCEISYCPSELALDGVPGPAGGSRVVRFVQDKEGAGAKFPKEVSQARDVGLLNNEGMRDDEARACGPRIDAEAAFASQRRYLVTVDSC